MRIEIERLSDENELVCYFGGKISKLSASITCDLVFEKF